MNYIKKNKIILLLVFIIVIFLMKIFKTSYKLTNFNYGNILLILLISLFFYVLCFKVIRKPRYRILFLIGVIGAIFVTFLCNKSFFYGLFNSIPENLYKANDLMSQGKEIDYSLLSYVFGLTVFLVSQIIFICLDKGKNNVIIIVSFICMLILWFTGFVVEVKLFIFPFIFLSITTYAFNRVEQKITNYMNKSVGIEVRKKEILVYILVICFSISAIQVILPQNMNGKLNLDGDSFINDYFSDSDIKKIDNSKFYRYSLKDSGYFDSNEKLGGPVNIESGLAMKVKSDKPYYLKGVTKDFYDGYSFKRTGENYIKYNKKNKNLSLINNEKFINQSKKDTLLIDPLKMKTTTIFTPNNTFRVDFLNNTVYYNNDLTFMSDDHSAHNYTDNFYESQGDLDIFDAKNIEAYEEVSPEDKFKETETYKNYLQVPSVVPLSVYNTVYDLLKGTTSDAEKVGKIEAYLRSNYKYSLDVSEVPEGEEFISYFLFTEKKGYCTYFAATATIFCRIAGIPARYVEGFHMENVKDNNDFYLVDNEDAHAWTEVMLRPSMGVFTTLDCVPNATEEMRKEKNEDYKGNLSNLKEADNKLNQKDPNNVNKDVSKQAKKSNTKKYNDIYIFYLIIAIIIAYIMVTLIIHKNKKSKVLKSSSNIPLYIYSKKRLKTCGVNLNGPITDLEAVDLVYNEELKEKLRELVKLCYDEYYGGIKGEFDKKSFYVFLEHFISGRQRKISYIFKKYFTRI